MKVSNFKKIILMISAAAIVLAALPAGMMTFAGGEPLAPELKSYAGTVLFSDTTMHSCTVGTDYATVRFNAVLPSEAYNKDDDTLIVSRAVYDYIEFDVYIEDYDAFMHSLSYDASGNPLDRKNSLMFNLSPRGDFELGEQGYQWKHLETQITKSGWNHILLNLYNNTGPSTMWPITSSPTGSADNRFYSLFIGEDNGQMWAMNDTIPESVGEVSHATTETQGSVFAFTNVSLTAVSVPEADFSVYGMVSSMGNNITEQAITPDARDENKQVTYSEINKNTKWTESFESDINCNDGEYIEFDLFCENPKVLSETLKGDGMDYRFVLTDKNGKTASADFLDKAAQGWSRIRLPLTSFTHGEFDFGAVSSYALLFEGKNPDEKFAERKQELSLANMYLTGVNGIRYKTIENKTDIPLFTGIKNITLGENPDTLFLAAEQAFAVQGLSATDLSAADYIGFDLHISNQEKYNSMVKNNTVSFWLSSGGKKSSACVSVPFDSYRQSGEDNWLHFFIPKADFTALNGNVNWKSVNACGIGFENPTAGIGDLFDLEMGLTNIGGYTVGTPQGDLLGGITATLSTGNHKIVTDDDGFTYDISGFEPVKFASGSFLEMDVFAENSEKLNKAIAAGASLSVVLTNESGQTMKLEFLKLLAHDGWNHLALSRDVGVYDSFQSRKLVNKVTVVLEDEQNDVSLRNMTLLFSNLYFTSLTQREEGILKGGKIQDFITKANSGYLTQSFSSSLTAKTSETVDFTDILYVEFDFYCQDRILLERAMKEKNNGICLTLTDDHKTTYTAEIWPFIEKNGWNHVAVPYGNFIPSRQSDTQNMKNYTLSFSGDISNQNNAKNASWAIANVCISGFAAPAIHTDNAVTHTFLSKAKSGTIGEKLTFRIEQKLADTVSLEDSQLIEFDFYVEDQKTYMDQFALGEDGTNKDRCIAFTLKSDEGTASWVNWAWQVKKDGWNHIQLPIRHPNAKSNWDEAKKSVAAYSFSCDGKPLTESSLANGLIMVANITATKLTVPEKPSNTLNSIGTFADGTFGTYFHFVQDRVFEYKINPVDLSKGSSIEFDLYITGYEELLAAEAGTWRDERICLMLSSTYPSLWEGYRQPHLCFCSYAVFDDQITHNGWNHIKLGLPEFEQFSRGQAYDFSKTTAWAITFTSTTNVYPEFNPANDVYIYVTNVSSCGYYVDIPADKEMPSKPDKSSVYITSCDSESDEYGVWNETELNTKYKSEGAASVGINVTYLTEEYSVKPTYIFDETADLSDLSELKFDVFTNFPQFLGKQGNKAEVLLATDKIGKNDYYRWDLDFSQITKTGWNSVSLNIKNAARVGDPDIKNIKAIIIRYNELNLSKDLFETFSFYLDNIRYTSSTGNTVLKINRMEEELPQDTQQDLNFYGEEETVIDEDKPIAEEPMESDLTETKTKPVQNIIRAVKRILKADYLTAGIIVGAETLVLAAVFVVIVLLRKKKKDKNKA